MKLLFAGIVAIVLLLHQDMWFWKDRSLVFGSLPIGLAYHAGYAILATLTMATLVRYFWPAHLEDEDEVEVATPPVISNPAESSAL